MNRIIQLQVKDFLPESEAVFRHLGIPKGVIVQDKFHVLLEKTMEIFIGSVEPRAILAEVSVNELETIFPGEGENAQDSPLEHIFPIADHLALYALTMGENVCGRIQELFDTNEIAIASMLDAVASLAADNAAANCESLFYHDLSERDLTKSDTCVLGYSPGYCGWHISGQKKLFSFLEPEQIGVSLNNSYLMIPIKSVSGVLVAGKRKIHYFESSYPFCDYCKTYSCRVRMKSLSIAS